jgi:2-keto-4-pentenoate hydratase
MPAAGTEIQNVLAERILSARSGGPRLDPEAFDAAIESAEDAYAVQQTVARATGPVGAFKTARKPGQLQIMAPIFARDIRRNPAEFDAGTFNLVGIELELGFLVTGDLPPAGSDTFRQKARNCVALVPAIEIVDTRLTGIEKAGPLLRLADNQLNGGLVYGEPVADWHSLDLSTVTARLTFNGETVLDGDAPVPGGDAFETFCGLAEMVGSHCGGLKPGHVVITGSLNGLPFVEPGTHVQGFISGVGEITVSIGA